MSVKRLIKEFIPEKYNLDLDLSNIFDRKFNGKVEIFGVIKNSQYISIHSKDLDIKTIKLNRGDGNLEFIKKDNDEIQIDIASYNLKEGDGVILELEFSGDVTDAMHGLYPCYYNDGDKKKEMFATQFESHHAREVFPCLDEPEAKAIFNLTLITPKNIEVIANTNIQDQTENNSSMITIFESTPKMSTYLLAFALGDFQRVSKKSKSGVTVSVLATKAQDPGLLKFPLDFATRVLDFYEDYFGQPFPLKKCDHIALPDFSSGAMENWGLITYRETALLAGPNSSISAKKYVALVIAHETSHQWFGNLVTMAWWDDLWLNESFATMMEYLATDALEPNWKMWEEFAVNEAVLSLRRDAIDGVQSVHVPVHHPDEIGTIFDGAIVYAKGARLMNMLRNYVGTEAFRNGLRKYFEEFKYKNTVGSDLWRCLSDSSGKDIEKFMSPWLNQSGYPSVSASLNFDKIKLSQKQFFIGEGVDKDKVWPILLGSNNKNLPEIMESKEIIADTSGEYLHLNKNNIAHFIANYSEELFSRLLEKVNSNQLDTISRLQLLQERSLLSRGGVISSADLLKTLESYSNETSLNVWDMINLLVGELKIFVDEGSKVELKMKKFVEKLAIKEFNRLGFEKKKGESEEDTQNRSTILSHMIYSENKTAVRGALEIFNNSSSMMNIDSEIRSLILTAKVRFEETPELIDKMLEDYSTTPNVDYRDDLLVAFTSTKNPETAKKLLGKIVEGKTVRPQDVLSWYIHLLVNSKSRRITWDWLRKNWAWIENTFDGDKSYNDFPRYSGSILRTKEYLEEFKEFFEPLKKDPSLTRAIEMGEKEIQGRINLIERDKKNVEDFLINR